MTKTIISILFVAIIYNIAWTQTPMLGFALDSLENQLMLTNNDTSRVMIMEASSTFYMFTNPDSALIIGEKALKLSRKINFPKGESRALNILSYTYKLMGNFSKALEITLKSVQIAEKNNLIYEEAFALGNIGDIYLYSLDYSKYPSAIFYCKEAIKLFNSVPDYGMVAAMQEDIGLVYLGTNKIDSAQIYLQITLDNTIKYKVNWFKNFILTDMGNLYAKKGNISKALDYFNQAIEAAKLESRFDFSQLTYLSIATTYRQINKIDSAVYFAGKSLDKARKHKFYPDLIAASSLLADLYKQTDSKKAVQYYEITIAAKDSLYNLDKSHSFDNLNSFDAQERQFETETTQNKTKQYALFAVLGIFSLLAFILYRNNRQKQKANNLLQEQKEEIQNQRAELQKSLTELKSTQNQLVQKEKLASLGELTAGIAHEIQNPLNFVNNFSELSVDLAKDLKEEIKKPKIDIDYVDEIIDDLTSNQQKINHHGKRASSIVKGMLEHSRSSTGEREPTDINKLADEYLRLSYHGLRAKDKNFNADYKTDFDESLPKLNVVPRDIGRVLLNLINNAFYAVNERAKQNNEPGRHAGLPLQLYTPLVSVSTKKIGDKIEIIVKDNGNGIPDKIKEKIFQPFFTTKPTGEGTGLGLSLAYDIIVKGHDGEIKIHSVEGEGSEFIVNLPIK